MATHYLLLLGLLASSHLRLVAPFKFEVGEDLGWAVPPSNDTNFYNKWASDHRFQIGDTVGYDNCNAANPIRYYNNGDTTVTLEDAGYHYFISGLSSHCEKGQKMIIKVMSHPKTATDGSPPSDADESGAVAVLINRFSSLGLVQLSVLVLGFLYVQS
ncbi:hypothetical protein H6P81_014888 [Aristolochia fimbriata]|uniref:Phytocyanin domain-containing protein n=1 Tax=Aristolochia fimbriata TaxID=158543 RepID=A0AAV7E4M3_ARIFI|nr:hypothetical protein H6P81_014888 [Aristolochia fimbriata]